MTGGGLLGLIAYGAQNVILSGNPQMTFFYKAFRKYSHFSQESISTAMDGQNELFLISLLNSGQKYSAVEIY